MNDRHPSGTRSPAPAPGIDYASSPAYGGTQGNGYGDGAPLQDVYAGAPGAQATFTPYDTGSHPQAGYASGGDPYATGTYSTAPSDGYSTGTFPAGAFTADTWAPDTTGTYDTATDTGTFTPGAFAGGGYDTGSYDMTSATTSPYDTGSYNTGAHDATSYDTNAYDTGSYDPGAHGTGAYDTGAFSADPYDTGSFSTDPYDTGSYGTLGHGTHAYAAEPGGGNAHDSGAWQFPQPPTPTRQPYEPYGTQEIHPARVTPTPGHTSLADPYGSPYPPSVYDTGDLPQQPLPGVPAQGGSAWSATDFPPGNGAAAAREDDKPSPYGNDGNGKNGAPGTYQERESSGPSGEDERHEASAEPVDRVDLGTVTTPPSDHREQPEGADGSGSGSGSGSEHTAHSARGRTRRRMPAKRSALLTIAVPSACVMGVAGVAAASVGDFGGDGKETGASSSPAPVKPAVANNKLDTQLARLSEAADDVADRASRTQERIDLKAKKAADHKAAIAEAARKERERPKFALPVAQRGLSAYFGQAGVNWMSQHTGIDFPVSYGTPVMAATDGTVRGQWNSAYGNMAIVTAKDGTETWYCHLSSTSLPTGTPVKAGQQIAHSGNSGNSTGPHMHFEVRPGGGAAIDPLPWLRSHGLNPN